MYVVKSGNYDYQGTGSKWSYFSGGLICQVRVKHFQYYRKRGSASYIVREVLSVREGEREREIQTERERERERERDGSDVTIVALKLAMNF